MPKITKLPSQPGTTTVSGIGYHRISFRQPTIIFTQLGSAPELEQHCCFFKAFTKQAPNRNIRKRYCCIGCMHILPLCSPPFSIGAGSPIIFHEKVTCHSTREQTLLRSDINSTRPEKHRARTAARSTAEFCATCRAIHPRAASCQVPYKSSTLQYGQKECSAPQLQARPAQLDRIPKTNTQPTERHRHMRASCPRLDHTNEVTREAPNQSRAGLSVDEFAQRESQQLANASGPTRRNFAYSPAKATAARPRTGGSGRPQWSRRRDRSASIYARAFSGLRAPRFSRRAVALEHLCVLRGWAAS